MHLAVRESPQGITGRQIRSRKSEPMRSGGFHPLWARVRLSIHPGNIVHRVRLENLHNFEKNLDQNGFYEKSWSILKSANQKIWDRKFSKISIEISIENCMEMKKIKNIRFQNFCIFIQFSMKISRWKFSKNLDLKNFGWPISKCSNFFRNKPFWSRFFFKVV